MENVAADGPLLVAPENQAINPPPQFEPFNPGDLPPPANPPAGFQPQLPEAQLPQAQQQQAQAQDPNQNFPGTYDEYGY